MEPKIPPKTKKITNGFIIRYFTVDPTFLPTLNTHFRPSTTTLGIHSPRHPLPGRGQNFARQSHNHMQYRLFFFKEGYTPWGVVGGLAPRPGPPPESPLPPGVGKKNNSLMPCHMYTERNASVVGLALI